jgi:single-stranded-DNA-specific exonuclease
LQKRWHIQPATNAEQMQQLQAALNVDRIVANLLMQRGINTFESAKSFFRPNLSELHDPFLMKGMQTAIHRIEKAISQNEKIMVYGDYDVDGTSAVSLVYSFFKQHTSHIHYYIPDRYKEGYGISFAGIDYAAENNYSLIIALDCGIKAIDKVEYANSKKVDFIICDHHLAGDNVPAAIAILDQKQYDCPYPYKELSGCGIGFKLIQAYSIFKKLDLQDCYNYLDLVAVSIAADIVPITGENRILAHFGLEIINKNPRPGIKALLDSTQLSKTLTISSLVFVVGPRINAAGRIEHGSKAVELLICEEEEKALTLAKAINETNSQRKDLDFGTTGEALQMLEQDPLTPFKKSTVVYSDRWHKGVIGIVASRLIEKYYRPTIVITESEGKATGSARSVKEYDVYSAIEQCSELLDQFGGHKFAAGLTLKKENLEPFRQKFEAIVAASITDDQLVPKVEIDLEIELHEISDKLIRILKQMAPHGPANMTPTFYVKNVMDTGWARVVGNNHLKIEIFHKKNPNHRFAAMGFDKGDFLHFVSNGKPFDIVFKIQENEFKGVTNVQLLIEEIRMS